MCQTTQNIENSMFEVPESSLVELESMISHPNLIKLKLSYNNNFPNQVLFEPIYILIVFYQLH